MAADNTDDEPRAPARDESQLEKVASEEAQDNVEPDSEDEEEDGDDDDDDVDEEPKLKYSRLTRDLGPVYRNGDATATFMVAGDKMVRS